MRTLLLTTLLAGSTALAQTCLPDGLSLTTQAQVDAFPGTYPGCTQVIGAVSISGGNITDLGPLGGLTYTGGLVINGATALTDLSGLGSLTTAEFVMVQNCSALTSLNGLDGLATVTDFLSIRDNAQLTSLQGLDALTSVGGYVQVQGNALLTDIGGLAGLTTVGEYFSIRDCALVNDLSALSALVEVGTFVQVRNLPQLTSLHGLDQVDPTPLQNYNLLDCPLLTDCAIASLCGFIANGGGPSISNNGTGCATIPQVTTACATLSVQDVTGADALLGPNPTHDLLQVRTEATGQLQLLDLLGRLVHSQRTTASISTLHLGHLPAGTYVLEFRGKDRVLFRERVVVAR